MSLGQPDIAPSAEVSPQDALGQQLDFPVKLAVGDARGGRMQRVQNDLRE